MIGKITGRTVAKNKDDDTDVLLLQVELTDDDDGQTVELMGQAGEDYNPPDGSMVAILPIAGGGEADKIGVATDDGITPSVEPGERELYSSADGAKKATIKLAAGGDIELNDNTDNAVRYSALLAAFSQLVVEVNAFITLYNAHLPTPVTPAVASAASVVAAKVNTIKVPLND